MVNNEMILTQLSAADLQQLLRDTLEEFFEQKQLLTTADDADEIIDITEAARLIKKSPTTIYSWTSNGTDFPYMKRGNRLYFSKKAILQWIADGKCKTHTEIAAEASTHIAAGRRQSRR